MKSTTSALSAPFVLKVVGYVMILSSMIDFVTLLQPMKWQDDQWLGNTLIQTVDRGVFPLIGLVFVYVSSYLAGGGSFKPEGRNPFMTGRFVAVVLSGILGISFLLAIPIHFTNTNKVANAAIEEVNKKAKQAEEAVGAQAQQKLLQMQEQLKDKSKLEAGLKQAGEILASGQLNGQKLEPAQLEEVKSKQQDYQKLKEDPGYAQTIVKKESDQDLQKIRTQKDTVEKQAREGATRTYIRTGFGSLLLSVAFSIIAWLGLTELGVFAKKR
jgi:hypothetical protein